MKKPTLYQRYFSANSMNRRTVLSIMAGAGLISVTSQQSDAQSESASGNYEAAWHRSLSASPTWPVAYDGVAYIADTDGNIFGYDARSGESQFKQSVDGSITEFGLTVADSTLAVMLKSGRIRFFDLKTQEPVESFPISGQPAGITSFKNFIYVIDKNSVVKKFDASGPEPLWRENLGYGHARNPQTPLVGENGLLIKQSGTKLLFVDPADGTVLEEINQVAVYQGAFGKWTGTISGNSSTACVVEKNSNAAYIFDFQNGTTRQLQYTNTGVSTCGPADGLFFIGGSKGINTMRETTGESDWGMNLSATKLSFDVFGEQLVAIGRVDTGDGTEGFIRARHIEQGEFEWEVPLSEPENLLKKGVGGYTFTKPIRIDNHYIVGGSKKNGNWIASFGPQQKPPDDDSGEPPDDDSGEPPDDDSGEPNSRSGLLDEFFPLSPVSKLATIITTVLTAILVWLNINKNNS